MTEYPRLLVWNGKHGDVHILIRSKRDEGPAWLAMFKAIDQWAQYYTKCGLHGAEVSAYARAKAGDWQGAKWLLQARDGYEYERVTVEGIWTPEGLEVQLNQ